MYFPRSIFLLFLLLISACGGSKSNSGGGSFVVFIGEQRIQVTRHRIIGDPITIAFRLERDGDQITVVDQSFRATATLVGSDFSVESPVIEVIINGGPCEYQIIYTGRITDSSTSGDFKGPLDCGFPGTLSGTFSATPGANNSQLLPSVSALLTGG